MKLFFKHIFCWHVWTTPKYAAFPTFQMPPMAKTFEPVVEFQCVKCGMRDLFTGIPAPYLHPVSDSFTIANGKF